MLFSKNLPKPQNYTLIFKYIGSELSPNITYARFNVQNTVSGFFPRQLQPRFHFFFLNWFFAVAAVEPEKTSFAALELSLEKDKERTLQATINIVNGTRIHVTAAVHGPSVSVLDAGSVQRFALLRNQAVPKTMTIVYGHNATKTRNRKVILGQRQPGDKLIDFQTKNVTLSFRFAETEFEYHDKQKHITSVGFSFNVRILCFVRIFAPNNQCAFFFIVSKRDCVHK